MKITLHKAPMTMEQVEERAEKIFIWAIVVSGISALLAGCMIAMLLC